MPDKACAMTSWTLTALAQIDAGGAKRSEEKARETEVEG